FDQALKISKDLENRKQSALAWGGLAAVTNESKKYEESSQFYIRALTVYKDVLSF
ncbi:MAG: hypothetical protein ACI9BD_001293, partial [Candidatus Marinamargulisbacteria bacterium]